MFSLPMRYENIREVPYPYKGMCAISSDAEYTSYEMLDWLITYLNTDEKTPLGYGLDLDFAASIFFYSDNPLHTSIYDSLEVDSKETPYANVLRDYIKCGYIDTNHAFGDFNIHHNFNRTHALKVYEMLSKHSLSLPIFTNHGNGEPKAMQHNIGFAPYHNGSNPDSKFYHTDLSSAGGGGDFYVWSDDWVIEKFPKISLTGNINHTQDGRQLGNFHILQKLFCGDRDYDFFTRYRSTGCIAPTFQTFNYQIQSIDWETFYNQSSVVIFYQHFGSFYVANAKNIPSTLELLKKFPFYLRGFRFLKEEQEKGNLLVLKTSKLLRYCKMYMSTKAESLLEDNQLTLTLHNYENIEDLSFFDGLTIYVENYKNIALQCFYKDKPLKFIYNGLDARGKYSITLDSKQGEYYGMG